MATTKQDDAEAQTIPRSRHTATVGANYIEVNNDDDDELPVVVSPLYHNSKRKKTQERNEEGVKASTIAESSSRIQVKLTSVRIDAQACTSKTQQKSVASIPNQNDGAPKMTAFDRLMKAQREKADALAKLKVEVKTQGREKGTKGSGPYHRQAWALEKKQKQIERELFDLVNGPDLNSRKD
jgi:hypothetical protein